MISNASFELIENLEQKYLDCLASITEISKDSTGGKLFIEMDFQCLHLVQIPYLLGIDLNDKNALSVDTILFDRLKSTLYLVEFKSSWPKDKTAQQLRFKCYESLAKLLKYWTLVLEKDRKEFFELKINYCVITRAKNNQDTNNKSFLDALDSSANYFKLKYLDGAFVDKTRILLQEETIFKFLARVTGVQAMNYHYPDGSVKGYN